jgi:hypothetical protein
MLRLKFQLVKPKPCPPWILLLIGGIFLCVGAGFGIHSVMSIQGASLCEGTVIAIGPKIQFANKSVSDGSRVDSHYVGQETTTQTNPSPPSRPQPYQKKRGRGSVPEVRYSVDGTDYIIYANISTSPSAYAIGQKVPVYFFPERAGEGVVGSFVELWLFSVIFGGIGLVISLVGGFIVLRKLTNPVT